MRKIRKEHSGGFESFELWVFGGAIAAGIVAMLWPQVVAFWSLIPEGSVFKILLIAAAMAGLAGILRRLRDLERQRRHDAWMNPPSPVNVERRRRQRPS